MLPRAPNASPAALLNELTDPELKGFVQQMMNDHQQLFSQFYQLV